MPRRNRTGSSSAQNRRQMLRRQAVCRANRADIRGSEDFARHDVGHDEQRSGTKARGCGFRSDPGSKLRLSQRSRFRHADGLDQRSGNSCGSSENALSGPGVAREIVRCFSTIEAPRATLRRNRRGRCQRVVGQPNGGSIESRPTPESPVGSSPRREPDKQLVHFNSAR